MLPIIIAAGAAVATLFVAGCSGQEEVVIEKDPARIPLEPLQREQDLLQPIQHSKARINFRQWTARRDLLDHKIDLYYRRGERDFDIYAPREDFDTITYILNEKRTDYPELKWRIFYFEPSERPKDLPKLQAGKRVLLF